MARQKKTEVIETNETIVKAKPTKETAKTAKTTVDAPIAVAEKPAQTRKAGGGRKKKSLDFNAAVTLIHKSIKVSAAKKITDTIAAEVTITGEAEGTLYIKVEGGSVVVEPYDYVDKDLSVVVDTADLNEIRDNKVKALTLFEQGKIQVYGDVVKAVKFASLF